MIQGDYENSIGCLIRNYRPKLMEIPSVQTGKYQRIYNKLNSAERKYQNKSIKANEIWLTNTKLA